MLGFTIYDNLGNPIEAQIVQSSQQFSIQWYFPVKDTLLISQDNGNNDETEANREYEFYKGNTHLSYNIYKIYDINKARNQINLNVTYKGMDLTAITNFTFVKQLAAVEWN